MAPFHFEADGARRLLTVTKQGYWTMETFMAFADAFHMELRRMKAQGGCRYCLVDATHFAVQSAEVAGALQALVDSFPEDCPARMAGISGSKLSELQARHRGEAPGRRVFPTREAAEAWLFSA